MNFQIVGLATIRICSKDVAKSRDWYSQLFGVSPIKDITNFASFKIGGICLDISLADGKSPSSTGGSVAYWRVEALDQAINKALALGGEIYRGPLRIEEIKRTIVQIKDPIENVIGFEAPY